MVHKIEVSDSGNMTADCGCVRVIYIGSWLRFKVVRVADGETLIDRDTPRMDVWEFLDELKKLEKALNEPVHSDTGVSGRA